MASVTQLAECDFAGIAQVVEHFICNEEVGGSWPPVCSKYSILGDDQITSDN